MSTESAPSQFTVAIAPLGSIPDWQIKLTALVLQREFEVKTMLLPAMEPPLQYFNAERSRYQAYRILDFLFSQLPVDAQRIMGIIEGGLENDKNEPCYGSAYPHNNTAIYRVPLQLEQIKKQIKQDSLSYHLIVHEFGHTLGLPHCDQPDCAMNSERCSVVLCAGCHRWADRELKVQPGSAEERFSFAESLFTQNCLTQAIVVYREAVLCAPNEPLYHNRLANALYITEQKDEAGQEFDLAIKLSNDNHCHYALGILGLTTNQLKRAEDYFAKAIATAKDPKLTQKIIGQAYREISHDVELASRHYKEYLLLGGYDQDVVEWLVSRSQIDRP